MKITPELSDEAILGELGGRLAAARVGRNLTQAALAEQAGVAKRTVERLESGEVAAQLTAFLRVCRVLGLIERLDALLPEPGPGPMEQLKRGARRRRRVRTGRTGGAAKAWTWGEPS